MQIALIAHDNQKNEMIQLVKKYKSILEGHYLLATGTTGKKINAATGLTIKCLQSGPYGGDQEIGTLITKKLIDFVVFLRDPLTAHPHEPDVSALMRLCDVYKVPLATNVETAKVLIHALEQPSISVAG
ncbi:methylglyoxal synthase [Bacillus sp. 123MFChir2]|uniref:methylglyoxal synthase n=1 Tax=Bacillus sp. 123MFChir2 TaxID=1169144 RepID=UPI00036748FE|nr:methylglyoxal synthase [Bacillus sp. 123MFChir2]